MKRFLSILLTLTMILGLGVSAFAGSISIARDETHDGTYARTYTAYKIFDADTTVTSVNGQADTQTIYVKANSFDSTATYYTYNATSKAYEVATVADATAFAAGTYYTAVAAADTAISYSLAKDSKWLSVMQASGQTWFDVKLAADESKYVVTLKEGIQNTTEVAKAIADYLNKNIPSDAPKTTITPGTAANVDNGYYLITASDGATNLTLVTTDVTIIEKNEYLHDEKTVETAPLEVGGKATYYVKVDLPASIDQTKPVIVHDTMDSELTFDNTSVKAYVGKTSAVNAALAGTDGAYGTSDDIAVAKANFTYAADSDYTLAYTAGTTQTDGCTFEITIPAAKIAALMTANATTSGSTTTYNPVTVIFQYQAEVNSTAVGDDGFINKEFSSQGTSTTTPSEPIVYTFDFNLDKTFQGIQKTDTNAGNFSATFELYNATEYAKLVDNDDSTTATPIGFIKDTTGYVKADSDDSNPSPTLTVTAADTINVRGLADATYYLVEKTTTTGYNLLDVPIIVTITDTTSTTSGATTVSHTVSYKLGENGEATAGGDTDTVAVVNNSGSVLPSTGGIGTTIFYIVGGLLAVGAGVVLVTKKRMGKEEN